MLDFEYFLPRETLFAELNGWAGHANGLEVVFGYKDIVR